MPPQLPRLAPPFAGQPDIVLASQKDQFHVNEFRDDVYSFFEGILKPQQSFGAKAEIFLLADLVYYWLTKDRQTLGEEYCDVFLFETNGQFRFRKYRILLAVCLAVGPYLLQRLELGGWQSLAAAAAASQRRRSGANPMQQQQRMQQNASSSSLSIPKWLQTRLLQLVSLAARIHLAVFYYRGDYLSPIRRVLGAKYLFTREPSAPRPGFQVLSYFIGFQLALEFVQRALAFARRPRNADELRNIVPSAVLEEEESKTSSVFTNPCGICLSKITAPACPPCGHVYCYECIVESTIAKSECPLCRREAVPQSILCIYE